ncbi:hypothetical protein ACOMCU_25145 [Lysinibacillus sp. UGB7]|uniref:hypothetical protein n=1 Tax=Lysinibacillus sp. UGB7 TaxID=3411039 RepID=UPI003B7A63C5
MSTIIFIHKVTKLKFEFSYIEIRSQYALQFQKELLMLHVNRKEYEIFCSCNKLARMHTRLNSNSGKIYFATNAGLAKEHKEGCIHFENLTDTQLQGVYYPAIEIKSYDHIKLSVNHLGIVDVSSGNNRKKSYSLNKRNSYNKGNMTIGSFGRELLSRAWELAMDNHFYNNIEENGIKKYKYPSIFVMRQALSSLFIGKDNPQVKVEISKKNFLQDKLMLGFEKTGRIYHENKRGVNPVILMPFKKENIEIDFDESYHLLKLPGYDNNERELLIDKNEWLEITKTDKTRVNYYNHNQFFIIGLGKTNTYNKPPIIYNAELIPTTDRGLFVDSSFENKLFVQLEKNRRNFIKPNQLLEVLDFLKPDAILRDTYRPYIIEVFGMSESEMEYHKSRLKKIEYYESLSDYGFYKWDAFNMEDIKPFPKKIPGKTKER